jgi:hypothetical protein
MSMSTHIAPRIPSSQQRRSNGNKKNPQAWNTSIRNLSILFEIRNLSILIEIIDHPNIHISKLHLRNKIRSMLLLGLTLVTFGPSSIP